MQTDFLSQRYTFPSLSGGPQSQEHSFTFPSPVQKAQAAINGFHLGFTGGDHHVWKQLIDANVTSIAHNTVNVRVDFMLRDSSGNYDDKFEGYVDVLVIANRA